MRRSVALAIATVAVFPACRPAAPPPPPELTVVGESTRVRMEASRAERSAWFDGTSVSLVSARGETLGIQVVVRTPVSVKLLLPVEGVTVSAFNVESFTVVRPSTAMYGGSQGLGSYPDVLHPTDAATTTNPGYFEISIAPNVRPGTYTGELVVDARTVPVALNIAPVTLPPLAVGVWAYGDPRELAWATNPTGDPPRAAPSASEKSCIETFRTYGVLLSPMMKADWWEARRTLMGGVQDIPVWLSTDPVEAAREVREWIAKTAGTGMVPFAIPVDEPRSAEKRTKLQALAPAVRAAGGGPTTFRLAVTTDIDHERYGNLIDLYITPHAKRSDKVSRWTYNGAPPHAGSLVLDAVTPGTRTWGVIAWRWNIPLWYVWDALYWHDRHNRKGAPLPGKPLLPAVDPVSFDDGGDHGNLDGVLALPEANGGCTRTLRLASIRRGLQDKALLDLAARCDRSRTEMIAARLVPRALGDAAAHSERSWSADESEWERARRDLIELASCGSASAP